MREIVDPVGTGDAGLVECQMCHRPTPESATTMMTGRRLCAACAAAWFEEDDEE